MATHKHSGDCGRCGLPTGSLTAAFCPGCRLVAVMAANHARKGLPCAKPKRGGKATPEPVRFVATPPADRNLSPRSWWAGVTREQLSAAVALELPRMTNSDLGRARGGLSQDIY